MRSELLVIAAMVVALSGCNRPNLDRTSPDRTTSLLPSMASPVVSSLITPPAAPERGPIPPGANAVAPGTDASLALANKASEVTATIPSNEDNSPEGQHVAVAAQDAAVKAPDTAAADAAKRRAYETPMADQANQTGAAFDEPATISPPSPSS